MSGRPRERLTCSTPKQIVFGAASEDINKAHAVMLIAQKLGNTKLWNLQGYKGSKAWGSQAKKVETLYLPANSAMFNSFFSDWSGAQTYWPPKFDGLLIPKIAKIGRSIGTSFVVALPNRSWDTSVDMAVPVPPAPPGGPYPASYPGRNFAFDAGKIGESKGNSYGNLV